MKTIIFFHRLELTELFYGLAKQLEDQYNIVHLAYSRYEETRLRELGCLRPITVFRDEIEALQHDCALNEMSLEKVDELFLRYSGGVFNVNSAIQSDRGFSILSSAEADQLTLLYCLFWDRFFGLSEPFALIHEPCSLMSNFSAAIYCMHYGAYYLYPISTLGPDSNPYHLWMSGFEFNCPDLERTRKHLELSSLEIEFDRYATFLNTFRSEYNIFMPHITTSSVPKLIITAAYVQLRNLLYKGRYDRLIDNIDYWHQSINPAFVRLTNIFKYQLHLRYDRYDDSLNYYFFPLHLEPESVILYQAHGLYENQVKLIKNVAAQLPAGAHLYVKDHPHDIGYRPITDYQSMQSVPNIKILDPRIPAKAVVSRARGVITVAGTAGFEAMLMGKPVFTFAKTFYSSAPNVRYVHNIRDLREHLYNSRSSPLSQSDDLEIICFLRDYFSSLRAGFTDYFVGRAKTRAGPENTKVVSSGLRHTLQGLL